MSSHNPPSTASQGMESEKRHEAQPVELERGEEGQPQLQWLVVENEEQSFLLEDDDYILDSYFNPEHEIWEVLIRLEPNQDAE